MELESAALNCLTQLQGHLMLPLANILRVFAVGVTLAVLVNFT